MTVRTPVRRFHDGLFISRPDTVVGEEPLEIRVAGEVFTVTMRTPGHDIELVHGLLHAEGVVTDAADVVSIRYCDGVDEKGQNTYNVVDVALAPAATERMVPARLTTTTSSCGVCGSASIETLRKQLRYGLPDLPAFDPTTITALPDALRAKQQVFRSTGGLHAAALVRPDGGIERVREDIGRHNAVDKVIGSALLARRAARRQPGAGHVVAGVVRARAEGGPRGDRHAHRGRRPVLARHRPRAGDGPHADRVRVGVWVQHLQRRAAGARVQRLIRRRPVPHGGSAGTVGDVARGSYHAPMSRVDNPCRTTLRATVTTITSPTSSLSGGVSWM